MIIDHCTKSESAAPELAKFILSRIVKNRNDVEQMEKEIDNNERLEFIFFFIDTGWISRNVDGTYAITMKCRNVIEQRN